MYLLTFHAVPSRSNDEFSIVGGAFINAWIPKEHANSREEAEGMARSHIESSLWFIKSLDRASVLDEDTFEPHEDDSEYYECALSGEQAFVFISYPNKE